MTSFPHPATLTVAAVACAAALVTACGASPSPPAAPTRTASAATAAGASAATPPAAASPAAATPAPATSAAQAGPAPCPTRSLGVKAGISQGTAGSTYTVIDFTNTSNVTCTLYGYPGVSLAGGKPVTQIGLAATESHATARVLVTLAPGAVANALLQIVHAGNYAAARCGPATADYLQIYPPNQTTPVYIGYTSPACSKPVQILTVSVVEPGAGSA
jgi:Domain of unknown function (DUF4232)